MNGIKTKARKFKSIYQNDGLVAVSVYSVRFLIGKTGWFGDKWILGKVVELRGNIGYLNGCRFDLDSPSITTARKSRFLMGRYERKEREAVRRFLNPELPVIELGACIGVVSAITNKKLKNPKEHVVVEANPELIPLLTKNRDLNNCSFDILNRVVGYGAKEILFYQNEIFLSGGTQRITNKPVSIASISLEEIFKDYKFNYANLICDVEGGEVDIINNEIELISKRIFQIIIEVHPGIVGEESINLLRSKLKTAGFLERKEYEDVYGSVLVLENSIINPRIK